MSSRSLFVNEKPSEAQLFMRISGTPRTGTLDQRQLLMWGALWRIRWFEGCVPDRDGRAVNASFDIDSEECEFQISKHADPLKAFTYGYRMGQSPLACGPFKLIQPDDPIPDLKTATRRLRRRRSLRFRVGGRFFRAGMCKGPMLDQNGAELMGCIVEQSSLILMSASCCTTPQQRLETLIHELTHAWVFRTGEPNSVEEWCILNETILTSMLMNLEKQGGVEAIQHLSTRRPIAMLKRPLNIPRGKP